MIGGTDQCSTVDGKVLSVGVKSVPFSPSRFVFFRVWSMGDGEKITPFTIVKVFRKGVI